MTTAKFNFSDRDTPWTVRRGELERDVPPAEAVSVLASRTVKILTTVLTNDVAGVDSQAALTFRARITQRERRGVMVRLIHFFTFVGAGDVITGATLGL